MLNSAEFFHLFHRVVARTDPRGERRRWRISDVQFEHDRHTHWNYDYAFHLDIYIAENQAGGWRIMVMRETWWGRERQRPLKSIEWSKAVHGDASSAIAWFEGHCERQP
jgi:hypothetical protein